MRWIDIELPSPNRQPALAPLLAKAAARCEELSDHQHDAGLDCATVVHRMMEVGQLLFRAATLADPEVFSPGRESQGTVEPRIGQPEADHVIGYHLITPPAQLALPWSWLHNGIDFLLVRHPLSASTRGSRPPALSPPRPWMRRCQEVQLGQQTKGARSLRRTLTSLRPRECADPEILFVPGHCEERIRRLIYREADRIGRALAAGALDRPLARLSIHEHAITPDLLSRRGAIFQGLHFAGPTSQPPELAGGKEAAWLAELAQAAQARGPVVESVEEMAGADLEVVGVDPITALLDSVAARAAANGPPTPPAPPAPATATSVQTPWLLEDGPVQPERLGERGNIPPLVFSNSYRALPELGPRFLAAGASTFIGPQVALYSRPARKFAGRFYSFLGDGYSASAALRAAALACREQFGEWHPAWLSYGLVGYGSLALQYL